MFHWMGLQDPASPIAIRTPDETPVDAIFAEHVRLLVLENQSHVSPRQAGRVRVQFNAAEQPSGEIIFDKPLHQVTAGDIRWMLDDACVQYCCYKNDLIVDFCILIPNYRENPAFQRY